MTRIELPGRDAVGIRADNPGLFTLAGTNTWIVGREPAWLIDPGPDGIPEHVDAVSAELDARGGLGAVVLTHGHHDHADAVSEIVKRFSPVPVASARVPASLPGAESVAGGAPVAPPSATHGAPSHIELHDGDQIGPLHVIAVPGHAPDHLVFVTEDGVAYTGDAVLGEGSVFVAAQMAEYLTGLSRVRAALVGLAEQSAVQAGVATGAESATPALLIAPGHGPVVTDPLAKVSEYIDHRLDRENALVAALTRGLRSADELLDEVWADAPANLRIPAGWTLRAHLEKLQSEGRLPDGVEVPDRPDDLPAV